MKRPGGFLSIIAIGLCLIAAELHAQIPCWLPVLWSASPAPLFAGALDVSSARAEWAHWQDGTAPAIAFWEGQLYQLWDQTTAGDNANARTALPLRWSQQENAHPFRPDRVVSMAVDPVVPSLPFIYTVQDDGQVYFLAPGDYHSPEARYWHQPPSGYNPGTPSHYRARRFNNYPWLDPDEQIVAVKSFQEFVAADDEFPPTHYIFLQTSRGRIFRGNLQWNNEVEPGALLDEHGDFQVSEIEPERRPGESEGNFEPNADDILPFTSRGLIAPISANEIVSVSSDGVLSVFSTERPQEILATLKARPLALSAYLLPARVAESSLFAERLVVWAIVEDKENKNRLIRWHGAQYQHQEVIELPDNAVPTMITASLARRPPRQSPAFYHPLSNSGWGERVLIGGIREDLFMQPHYQVWGIGSDGQAKAVEWLVPHHHREQGTTEFRVNPHLHGFPSLVKLFDEREIAAEQWLTQHFQLQTDPIYRLASLPHFLDANRRRLMLRSAFIERGQPAASGRFYTELRHQGIHSLEALHFAHEFLFQGGKLQDGEFPDRVADTSAAVAMLASPARVIFSNTPRATPGTRGAYTDAVFAASEWMLERISERYHLDRHDLDRWIRSELTNDAAPRLTWEFIEHVLRRIDPLRAITSRESLLTILGEAPSVSP